MVKLSVLFLVIAILVLVWSKNYDESQVNGYHFHVYFYSGVQRSTQEALAFRDAIQQQIFKGNLRNCIVKAVNMGAFGPHMVGNFETCCNATSIPQALSFFMLNHGNLSVLFHPLTRYKRMDHTDRKMILGPQVPIDVSYLSDDSQDNLDMCTTTEQIRNIHSSISNIQGPGDCRKVAPKLPNSEL